MGVGAPRSGLLRFWLDVLRSQRLLGWLFVKGLEKTVLT